ncbi:MAG TPA: hypothetical protein H9887_08710 [Candidatus Dorea intestinavium]|nr:hypothetical protein [Candidatus Dorea intestinavium]
MNWLDKLEKKFGRYAINNLMFYIVILYALGFVLHFINPNFYFNWLSLNPEAILRGQVWRIFTFIIQPPSYSVFWVLIALYMCYLIGSNIEAVWGSFKFNIYFYSGVLFNIIAGFITYFITGTTIYSEALGTTYISLSMFFVFASLFPETQFLLFFVIPVKVKWLAVFQGVIYGYSVLQAFMPAYGGSIYGIQYKANALAIVVSLLNFFIYFMGSRHMKKYRPSQLKRKRSFEQKAKSAASTNHYEGGAKHKCAVCGKTELDDPNLEFRYCSKCHGNYEYCQEHLFTHKHVE